jgi:ElaB/YqjD/DUF883 family membrane-anchored ribosome-binding protein
MNSTTRVNSETDTAVDFDAIIMDVAALRQDFADFMSQMKSGALKGANDTAENVLSQLGDRVSHLYDNVMAQGERSVKAVVSRQVEERPVVSLLIAFGVGFIASRLLSR